MSTCEMLQKEIQRLEYCIEGLNAEIDVLENSKARDNSLIITKMELLTKASNLKDIKVQAHDMEKAREENGALSEDQKKEQQERIRRSQNYLSIKNSHVSLINS